MSLVNCGSNTSDNNVPSITVSELNEKYESGEMFFLLDVRTRLEFDAGRLSFADQMIPYDSLSNYLELLPKDKKTNIYCFCRSGRRSGISTTYLKSVGYANVYNVTGGIIAWTEAGFETVSGK